MKKTLKKRIIGGITAIVAAATIGYGIFYETNKPTPANYKIIGQYDTKLSQPYKQSIFSNSDEIMLNGIKYQIRLSNDKQRIKIETKGRKEYIKNPDKTLFSGLEAKINKKGIEIKAFKETSKNTYEVLDYNLPSQP